MSAKDPKIDPATEAAIDRALEAANLRPGDSTASTVHPEHGDSAVDDGASGDGD
ncbi:hypothetical protein [Microbacterium abyssi]|uniref:hypothetical protein n=1 Tax=Microbacterium abyssi TaxID=2782166 RepID=UPI001888C924|nr:hypothetical protein [Microbacterium sp. A18JL241]